MVVHWRQILRLLYLTASKSTVSCWFSSWASRVAPMLSVGDQLLTRGALMKSFRGGKWRSWNVILRSDVSETRPFISFATLNFISSLFGFSRRLSQTQSLGGITCGFLGFSPTYVLTMKNYPVHWEESRIIPYLDTVISVSLSLISCSEITLGPDWNISAIEWNCTVMVARGWILHIYGSRLFSVRWTIRYLLI